LADGWRLTLAHPLMAGARAGCAFADPLSVTVHDPEHSADEARYVLVGLSSRSRLLVVVHVEQPNARLSSSLARLDGDATLVAHRHPLQKAATSSTVTPARFFPAGRGPTCM
jgi:hypothetical protein